MRYVTGALTGIFLLLVLIFAVQNRAAVDVSFLVWSFTTPKVLLILATYVLGMFSGWGVVEFLKRAF